MIFRIIFSENEKKKKTIFSDTYTICVQFPRIVHELAPPATFEHFYESQYYVLCISDEKKK